MTNEQRTQRLMTTFGFTKQMLEVNRGGILLPSQQAELQDHAETSNKATLILVPMSVIMVLGLGYCSFTEDSKNPPRVEEMLLFLVALSVMIGIAVLWYLFNARRWKAGKPFNAEGIARCKKIEHLSEYGSYDATSYRVTISGVKFDFREEREMNAFVDGTAYRVYFMPKTGINELFSAEAI